MTFPPGARAYITSYYITSFMVSLHETMEERSPQLTMSPSENHMEQLCVVLSAWALCCAGVCSSCSLTCAALQHQQQRWGLESLDSDSSRTRVPILLDSDSSTSHLDSDSRHADSDSTRTRTVGTRPDLENCTDKNRFQATYYLTTKKLQSDISQM